MKILLKIPVFLLGLMTSTVAYPALADSTADLIFSLKAPMPLLAPVMMMTLFSRFAHIWEDIGSIFGLKALARIVISRQKRARYAVDRSFQEMYLWNSPLPKQPRNESMICR